MIGRPGQHDVAALGDVGFFHGIQHGKDQEDDGKDSEDHHAGRGEEETEPDPLLTLRVNLSVRNRRREEMFRFVRLAKGVHNSSVAGDAGKKTAI